MGLQNQLNDVSSGSIPLLVLAQIATCVNYLRSMLLALLQSLGLCRFHTDQIVDDRFLAAVGSGLAGLIMLSDQLTLNNQFRYSGAAVADNPCVVCQASFQDGDQVRMLPCRHVFHRRCFDGWLHHYKFNCPLCRSPLLSDQRVALTERRLGQQLISCIFAEGFSTV
ncbi:E3 ubiquitin-protein ligase RHA2A, partial [Mucuna pruriens]